MKKTLIALATLASFAGMASAQSSVTVFGIVDATLKHGSGNTANKTQLGSNGLDTSRVGFRGTEDLGGGLSAQFWLEAGFTPDDGQFTGTNTNNQATGAGAAVVGRQGLTFNRRSTVSLVGGFGEVRLGRHFNPAYWNITNFDPFGTSGVGASQVDSSIITGATSTRVSNKVEYILPGNLGGFYGNVAYWFGEQASNVANDKDGNGSGLRLGFANGPFDVAFAYSKTKYLTGDATQSNIGGSWNFAMVKLMGQYERDELGTVKGKGGVIGATVPVGAGQIRVAYSRYSTDAAGDPTSKKLALGYVHNLSKRTALYATVARVKNDGFGAAAASAALNGAVSTGNGSSTGYDLGIRHSF